MDDTRAVFANLRTIYDLCNPDRDGVIAVAEFRRIGQQHFGRTQVTALCLFVFVAISFYELMSASRQGLSQLCFKMLFGNAAKLCLLCSILCSKIFLIHCMPQIFARTLTTWLCGFQKRCRYACTGYLASFLSVLNVSTIASTLALALLAGLARQCLDRSRVSRAAPVSLLIIAEICLLCWHYARCFRVPNMPDFILSSPADSDSAFSGKEVYPTQSPLHHHHTGTPHTLPTLTVSLPLPLSTPSPSTSGYGCVSSTDYSR